MISYVARIILLLLTILLLRTFESDYNASAETRYVLFLVSDTPVCPLCWLMLYN